MSSDLPDEMDLDLVRCIQIDALWCVQSDMGDQPDSGYTLRNIYRWYSKEFNTKLTEAEELPLPYVLQHYYEYHYANMSDWDFKEAVKKAVATRAEMDQMARDEAEELDAERRFMEDAQEEAKSVTAVSKEVKRVQEQIRKFKEATDMLGGAPTKAPKKEETEEPAFMGDDLNDLPEIEGGDDLLGGDEMPVAHKLPIKPKKW